MIIWRDVVFKSISDRLTTAILNLISRDRSGEVVDMLLLKDVIYSYGSISNCKC